MGYTHYWRQSRDFSETEWKHIQDFSKKLLKSDDAKKILTSDKKDCDYLRINDHCVVFNGKKELAHETFALERYVPTDDKYHVKDVNGYFNFCKTAEKPYDLYVVAMLVFANHLAPDALKLSSDGNWSDWKRGCQLASYVNNVLLKNTQLKLPSFLREDFKKHTYAKVKNMFGKKMESTTIH